MIHSQGHCPDCAKKVLTIKQSVNHLLHLILTICTFGLWIPVWVAMLWVVKLSPSRCTFCGTEIK